MMLLRIVGLALLSTWMPKGDWAIVLLTMRPNGTAWAMSVRGLPEKAMPVLPA